MIKKYVYGTPIETQAVVETFEISSQPHNFGTIDLSNGFFFEYTMGENEVVYGLGEANRGINKRGYIYVSNNTDDPNHTEDKRSLYGSHNFVILSGKETFGLFLDYPSTITFDIGFTKYDKLTISCEEANLILYVITGDSAYDVVKQFRSMIGRSYIPPKFAFGFGQSRWGYAKKEDFEKVARKHREHHVPIDMIYMDIDYMDSYKDFTVNHEQFPDFTSFISEMKQQNIRMIPIIDAGVKIEKGYDVYEEGIKNGFFCKKEDGSEFIAAVWPGYTHMPDFLNEKAREWFGDQYRFLIEQGIEGFWNDMNEPALFHTPEGIKKAKEAAGEFLQQKDEKASSWELSNVLGGLSNSPDDYKNFYHNINGQMIRHDKVHNLYGYNMTRAASEAFERIEPEKRFLMFSRSSYIGMHRYGGIWTGDNKSWWSHLLLNIKMMPSLNMCGFLYSGADIGGFGDHVSKDLLLRWLAFGVFTPLMRNHSAYGTREQEFYQFDGVEDFKHIIGVRYRLIPYLYSEFMKAALTDDMYFKPMAFVYPEDSIAIEIEDQLMLGNEIMVTPVYTQNATGRFVYLPEEMMLVTFKMDGAVEERQMEQGSHYIQVAINEVSFFIRKGKCIPVCQSAESVDELDTTQFTMLGYENSEYELYEDDGVHKDYENRKNYRKIKNVSR